MTDTFFKPKFTQAEIEEFGELLDIAFFLLVRADDGDVNDEWRERFLKFLIRRERLTNAVHGALSSLDGGREKLNVKDDRSSA